MTDMLEPDDRDERDEVEDDEDLLEQQEHKGYGEDEGERDESLPQ